jgi:hypothetical protein
MADPLQIFCFADLMLYVRVRVAVRVAAPTYIVCIACAQHLSNALVDC